MMRPVLLSLFSIGLFCFAASSAHSAAGESKYLNHWASYDEDIAGSVAEEIRLDNINIALDCVTLGRIFIDVDEAHAFSNIKSVGQTRIWLLVVQRIVKNSDTALTDIGKTDLGYALSGADRNETSNAIRKASMTCRKLLGEALERVNRQ